MHLLTSMLVILLLLSQVQDSLQETYGTPPMLWTIMAEYVENAVAGAATRLEWNRAAANRAALPAAQVPPPALQDDAAEEAEPEAAAVVSFMCHVQQCAAKPVHSGMVTISIESQSTLRAGTHWQCQTQPCKGIGNVAKKTSMIAVWQCLRCSAACSSRALASRLDWTRLAVTTDCF